MATKPPALIIHYGANYENTRDITIYVKELKITHEDIDGSKAGRDAKTGIMVRDVANKVHTLEVTLRRVTAEQAKDIHYALQSTSNAFYQVEYRSPCNNAIRTRKAYTATMNFGSQRYDRKKGECFYDGMTFKIIERGED